MFREALTLVARLFEALPLSHAPTRGCQSVTGGLGHEGAADWFDRWTALNRRARKPNSIADPPASPPIFRIFLLTAFEGARRALRRSRR
jgi:hypothetical protein